MGTSNSGGDDTYGDTLFDSVIVVQTHDEPSSTFPSFSQISLLCAIAFVAAGWAEARLLGPHRLRFVTAAVPVVVIGILWLATPGAVSNAVLDPWLMFALVAVAVALREVWFRRYAPQLQRPDPAAPEAS